MAQVYFVPAASATPVDHHAQRDAWIALLERWEWEWFCTFTFRDLVHPEAADKRFRVLISQTNRVLYGHRWYKKGAGLRWVRALEYQKRDVIHYHALMAGVQDLRRLTWMDRWHELAGYARIEPIESTAAVARYVSKYVVKGGKSTWEARWCLRSCLCSFRQIPGQVVTQREVRQVLSRLA